MFALVFMFNPILVCSTVLSKHNNSNYQGFRPTSPSRVQFFHASEFQMMACFTGKPVQYEVIVKTGDVRYAGTDANVYVIFVGADGKSGKMFMDDSSNNFERGMTESFKVCI